MGHFKPLHVAHTLQDLNQNINKNFSNWKKFPRPKDAAKKLYQESQTDLLDEERTYILLSRFLNLYEFLLETSDDKGQIELLLGKEADKASTQLAGVKYNLLKRYESEGKQKEVIKFFVSPEKVQKASVFKKRESNFISCVELHNALKTFNLLIMDVRDVTEFKQSHIKNVKCINIPENYIQSGLSAHTLGKTLPTDSLEEWEKRDSFDVIVLMDWYTNSTTYVASKLDKLRTILLEWDIGRTYNESPVILNNGYSEFLDIYPTSCTSSNIRYLKANSELDELLTLDSIEYPCDAPLKPIDPKPKEMDTQQLLNVDNIKYDSDLITPDKKEEIAEQLSKHVEDFKTIQNKIAKEYDIYALEELKRAEKVASDTIAKLRMEEKELSDKMISDDDELSAPVIGFPNLSPSQPSTSEPCTSDASKAEEERQRLLDQARQLKKPTMQLKSKTTDKPLVDRGTKPKNSNPVGIIPFETSSDVVLGLNGLVNIKNTCYLNTIIQCLRHIPEIFEFYCSNQNKDSYRQPCAISMEMENLVCALWSNDASPIKPIEFYNKLTILTPSYKEGHHEDCMEFFILLFTFLSEDCAYEISGKNCSSNSEAAWYRQHVGKLSYFIETFFYQMRMEQKCLCDGSRDLKYEIENVFYLTIPNHNFSLVDCLTTYLEDVDRFVCKKCNENKYVHKSICRYPPVLVIALKRHFQDGTFNNVPVFKKNESYCNFPIDNFKVDKVSYYLKAVAMHSGTTESGHYTAVCLNPFTKGWVLFNDEVVSPIDIRQKSIGVKAYAFFYSKTK